MTDRMRPKVGDVKILPIDEAATLDPANTNKHTQRGGGLLENSLRRRGANRSVASAGKDVETPVLTAGNYTYEKAVDAGFEKVMNVYTDGQTLVNVVRLDIAPGTAEAVALGIEDNEISKQSYSPDIDLVAQLAVGDNALLAALRESDKVFNGVLGGMGIKDEVVDAAPKIDRAEELNKLWQVKTGDLWRIGEHRLLCGDSTKREDVERVMGKERAVLFETDPPYGVDYIKVKSGIPGSGYSTLDQDYSDIVADNLKNEEMKEWLQSVFNLWFEFMRPNCAWYLWHPMLTQGYFAAAAAAAAAAANVIIHRQIIWRKSGFNLTRSGMYHWAHELCFYGWPKGNVPEWYGEKNQTTVWEIDRHSGKGLHPNEKPPELWFAPMKNHTKTGDVCAEPFAGSGSQYIAGEQLGRRVYGMELEPKYCAVILQRMSDAFPMLEIKRIE